MTDEMRGTPFPGPRPFQEAERDYFFGREAEVDEVVSGHIRQRRLCILTGESGAGKTSMLHAGVVPRLRYERELQRSALPPALVMRDWAGRDLPKFDDMFHHAMERGVEDAIAALRHNAPHDPDLEMFEHFLAEIRRAGSASARETIDTFANLNGGAILILDQFEEILRSRDRNISRAAQNLVSTLFLAEKRVRVLLSLRKEYTPDLRGLESLVGGLQERVYYLRSMRRERALDALQRSAHAAGLDVEPELLSRISGYLAEQGGRGLNGGGDEADLLLLQTLLHEIYTFARAETPRASLGCGDLDAYLKVVPEDQLAPGALRRWIERALGKPAREKPRGPLATVPDELVRRTAIRLGPFLASGDYKVPHAQDSLFQVALREDLERLDQPSGIARAKQWNETEVRAALQQAFEETLHRLYQANIIKPAVVTSDTTWWELVHDKLARPYGGWSEAQRAPNWCDSAAALTGSLGIAISYESQGRNQPTGVIEDVCWRGAIVSPARDAGPVQDVTFRSCDLRGVIFKRCDLRRVTFERCQLAGAIFEACSMGSGSAATTFEGCSLHGATFRVKTRMDHVILKDCHANGLAIEKSDAQRVVFDRCQLQQLYLDDVTLAGRLIIGGKQSKLTGAVLRNVKRVGEGGIDVLPECVVQYSTWDAATEAVLPLDRASWRASGPLAGERR